MTHPLGACAEEVRRHDHDRYLTALFAPAARREQLLALYALNLEVARTAEAVSENLLGEIRLQWWRETVEELFAGNPRRHYVSDVLRRPISEGRLTRRYFDAIIDGRAFDLQATPPEDLDALERYLSATSSALVALALELLDGPIEPDRDLVEAVGLAYGLVGIIRAVPFHARQQRCYLPADLLRQAGLAPEQPMPQDASKPLCNVVGTVAARAREHLRNAEDLSGTAAKDSFAAILPITLARGYLRRIEAAAHNPFQEKVQQRMPGAAWTLTWARLRGRA